MARADLAAAGSRGRGGPLTPTSVRPKKHYSSGGPSNRRFVRLIVVARERIASCSASSLRNVRLSQRTEFCMSLPASSSPVTDVPIAWTFLLAGSPTSRWRLRSRRHSLRIREDLVCSQAIRYVPPQTRPLPMVADLPRTPQRILPPASGFRRPADRVRRSLVARDDASERPAGGQGGDAGQGTLGSRVAFRCGGNGRPCHPRLSARHGCGRQ